MRLGTTELLLILGLAIVLFGGTRLAGLGKAMGQSIREFRQELRTGGKAEASESAGETNE